MKLKVKAGERKAHESVLCQVVWGREWLYSVGDDQKVAQWKVDGSFKQDFARLDFFPTCLSVRSQTPSVAVGTSEGKLVMLNNSGRAERETAGHHGALTCMAWSEDGTSLATGGEDANVKVWSSTSTCRFTIEEADKCVNDLLWLDQDTCILYCAGSFVYVHSLNQINDCREWRAHQGMVMQVDFNTANRLVISTGEDGKLKLWSDNGVPIFSSPVFSSPVYCARWAPNGSFFVACLNNELLLGDSTGRILSRKTTDNVLVNISWNQDSSHFAGSGADGNVYFGEIYERKCRWSQYEAVLNEENQIVITDTNRNLVVETLDPDCHSVVNMSLAYNQLVVATISHVYIWQIPNASTPILVDISSPVTGIIQTECFCVFLTADRTLQVYEYDGRSQAQPQTSQFTTRLSPDTVSANSEILAVVNYTNKEIAFLDPYSGEKIVDTFKHKNDILTIQISQTMSNDDSLVMFIDQNRDLYLFSMMKQKPKKISTMIGSCMWHHTYPILLTFSSNRLTFWYHPRSALWTDMELTKKAACIIEKNEIGRNPKLLSWHESQLSIERNDGAVIHLMVSPYVMLLHQCQSNLQAGLKLCQNVDEPNLWSCLACMAIEGNHAEIAVQAMKALNLPANLLFLQRLSRLKIPAIRNAELTAFRGEIVEAERILINEQLFEEAIKLDIRLCCWERALQNALSYKQLVPEVLKTREVFLASASQKETIQLFKDTKKNYSTGEVEPLVHKQVLKEDVLGEIQTLLFSTEV